MKRLVLFLLLSGAWAGYAQQAPILAAEYFFDNVDPGYGNAIPIPVNNPGESLDLVIDVPTTGLTPGIHQIDIRVKRDSAWSDTHRRLFFVNDTLLLKEDSSSVVEAEYFLGPVDPGYGNAIPLPVPAPGKEVELIEAIDLSNVLPGFHDISTRVRRSSGGWSDTHRRFFHIPDTTSTYKLIRIDYEILQGAALVNSSTIAIAPAQHQVEITFDAPTASLTAGTYEICVVAVDEELRESERACRFFVVTDTTTGGGGGGGGGGTPIDQEQATDIVVFPNPTTGPLTIESASMPIISYQLSDAQGRLLLREEPLPGTRQVELSISHFPRGTYFLATEVAGEVRVRLIQLN